MNLHTLLQHLRFLMRGGFARGHGKGIYLAGGVDAFGVGEQTFGTLRDVSAALNMTGEMETIHREGQWQIHIRLRFRQALKVVESKQR